jgi:hypothetical protein
MKECLKERNEGKTQRKGKAGNNARKQLYLHEKYLLVIVLRRERELSVSIHNL